MCAAVILAISLSLVCWYFGISSGRDFKAYIGMARTCHPVWQELALHRIYEGQLVDDVIKHTTPMLVVRHGRFVELTYQEPLSFAGVQIVAMDGRVTGAWTWSCTWDYTFFDSMTDGQHLEMSNSLATNERTLVFNGRIIARSSDANTHGVTMP